MAGKNDDNSNPGNQSMITGKSWAQMNDAEKSAHVIGRGESYNQPFFDQAAGQAWLDSNIGSAKQQTELFVDARDAAGQRIEDGTFNITDPSKIANAIRNAELATPASSTNSPFGGVATDTPASLGYSDREPVDLSPYNQTQGSASNFSNEQQTSGAWDNNQGWTLWNPETEQFESYSKPDPVDGRNPFTPGNGQTAYYQNSNGDHVLGFLPSTYNYQDDGTGNGSTLVGLTPQTPPPPTIPTGTPPTGTPPPPTIPTGTPPTGTPPTGTIKGPGDKDNKWDPGASLTVDPIGYQGGYDWNWESFQPGAPSLEGGGGYDPNDYAFDRYVPGQESPWGIPDVQGGNKDFYRNQFLNLLKDEQNFQNRQDESRQNKILLNLKNQIGRGLTIQLQQAWKAWLILTGFLEEYKV